VDLKSGHQVLVRRNPKPSSGYQGDGYITLKSGDSLTVDPARLAPGHKVTIRRAPKPSSGWAKDTMQTLTATQVVDIPALTTDPGPTPEPPPPSGALRGFGKNTKRSSASLTTVTSLSALRSAASAGGKNIKVDVPEGTVWSLAGQPLTPKSGTSIDFGNLQCIDATLRIQGVTDVFIENARFFAGDQYGNASDVDALNINGNTTPVRRVYVRNSTFLWGPDVVASFLGDVGDITVERCIMAEGLYNSRHAESPHSLGPNVASEMTDKPANNISFIECLVGNEQSRNFRLIGVHQVEVIGCTVWNYDEGPQGCPYSAMLLGMTWKAGPIGPGIKLLFRAQDGGHGAFTAKANTVYVGTKRQVIGFTDSGVDSKVKADSPLFTPTEPEPDAASAHQTVLSSAGAFPRDKQTTRVLANAKNGTGKYVNGYGKAESYTSLL